MCLAGSLTFLECAPFTDVSNSFSQVDHEMRDHFFEAMLFTKSDEAGTNFVKLPSSKEHERKPAPR